MGWRLFAGAFVAVLGFAACSGNGDGGGTPASDDVAAGNSVAVTVIDNEFDPADVSVPSGGTVSVSNEGESPHNFSVRGEGIDVDVQPGESASVDLSGLGAGSYELFCKLHEAAGMTGTLEIEG